MYDITDEKSFRNINQWVGNARDYADPSVSIMVLGNKCDLKSKRKIFYDDGLAFCQNKGIAFCEVSSLEGQNVDMAFAELCRMVEQRVANGNLPLENICPKLVTDRDADDKEYILTDKNKVL